MVSVIMLLLLFVMLVVGIVVDYFGCCWVLMVVDVLLGVVVVGVFLVVWGYGGDVVNVLVLVVLVVLVVVFGLVGMMVCDLMLFEVVVWVGWLLDCINGVYEVIFNLVFIVGLVIGGLMIVMVGGIIIMWIIVMVFGLFIFVIVVL